MEKFRGGRGSGGGGVEATCCVEKSCEAVLYYTSQIFDHISEGQASLWSRSGGLETCPGSALAVAAHSLRTWNFFLMASHSFWFNVELTLECYGLKR